MVHRISVLFVILIMCLDGVAQLKVTELPYHYVAPFRDAPPEIDGSLEDHFWEDISWTGEFQDIEGSIRPLPDYTTKVKMGYTDHALYIGAFIEDPHIWATLTAKNSPIYRHDKNFEVFIDPDGDHCNYYELELNALNTIWELTLPFPYRNGGKPINPDNLKGLRSAVNIQGSINDPSDIDTSWTVEIEIPFEEFSKYGLPNATPAFGDHWRINFSRVQWDHIIKEGKYIKTTTKSESNWVWSPQHQVNMHAPEYWGYLFFGNADHLASLEDQWKAELELVNHILGKTISLPRQKNVITQYNQDTFFILQEDIQHFINNKSCYWTRINDR